MEESSYWLNLSIEALDGHARTALYGEEGKDETASVSQLSFDLHRQFLLVIQIMTGRLKRAHEPGSRRRGLSALPLYSQA